MLSPTLSVYQFTVVLFVHMAVRQTVVASNTARQNLVPTFCRVGGPCAGGELCAGRLVWDRRGHFGVSERAFLKNARKPGEFNTFVFLTHQIHEIQPCAAGLVQPNLVHTNLVWGGGRRTHKVAQGTGALADVGM